MQLATPGLQQCLYTVQNLQDMVWTLKSNVLDNLPPWWQRIDDNPKWQDGAFIGLAACYGLIALVAVVQLIRIQRRVPEYGWTTQKVTPFYIVSSQ